MNSSLALNTFTTGLDFAAHCGFIDRYEAERINIVKAYLADSIIFPREQQMTLQAIAWAIIVGNSTISEMRDQFDQFDQEFRMDPNTDSSIFKTIPNKAVFE
jgi:hypothetical protein